MFCCMKCCYTSDAMNIIMYFEYIDGGQIGRWKEGREKIRTVKENNRGYEVTLS